MAKLLYFVGSALSDLRAFPRDVRRDAGYQLYRVQQGLEPSDWKPMPRIERGVREIRIHHGGEYRIIYVTKYSNAIYVLHAFTKKTQKTRKQDLELARQRLVALRTYRQ